MRAASNLLRDWQANQKRNYAQPAVLGYARNGNTSRSAGRIFILYGMCRPDRLFEFSLGFYDDTVNTQLCRPVFWYKAIGVLGIQGAQHDAAAVTGEYFQSAFLSGQKGDHIIAVFSDGLKMDKDEITVVDIGRHAVALRLHPYIFLRIAAVVYRHGAIVNGKGQAIPTTPNGGHDGNHVYLAVKRAHIGGKGHGGRLFPAHQAGRRGLKGVGKPVNFIAAHIFDFAALPALHSRLADADGFAYFLQRSADFKASFSYNIFKFHIFTPLQDYHITFVT